MVVRLKCGCGQETDVAESAAGTLVACGCGRFVSIPPSNEWQSSTGVVDVGRPHPKAARPSGTRPAWWKEAGFQVAYALVWLLASGFVVLGGGIMVLGFALFIGNRTGLRPTFPFAGFLGMTLGGGILKLGLASVARIRVQARRSTRTAASSAQRRPSPATPAPAPGTVELPLTSEMHRRLEATCSRSWRGLGVGAACLLAYTLVLGYFFVNEDGPVGMRYTFVPLGLGTGVGVIMLAALIGERWLFQRDLCRSTYLRTTGPMTIWVFQQLYQLKVADQKFTLTPQMAAKLSGLRWGVVDHTTRAHRILEVRDASGRVAYRL